MELDEQSRRILSLAREARTPTAQDKARVERRFALALGLSAAAGASAAAKPAVAASGTATQVASSAALLKWALGGCAVLAGTVAGYLALSSPAPAAPARVRAARPAAPALVELAAPAPETAAPAQPATSEEPRSTARPRRRTRTAGPPTLGAELELLHAAQAAWRAGDAARALSLAAEHGRRHPRSALGLERDALRVLALCDLGRTQEAARLGRAWLARAPSSPLRASIERSCAMD